MILRKPYAFLIKNFKLIHLILTGILIYICYKSYKILSFFNTYIASTRHDVIDGLSANYLGPLIYIAIIFVILISVIIFLLMKNKDKPYKYYLAAIIYYFLLIIGLVFISLQLDNISYNRINTMLLRISRDLSLVLFLAQIPFIIISLIRAIGFNIKKFNFQRDLMELQVDEKDNEEFELDIDIDSDDVKTRFRRRLRIIKYVLKENKLIVLALIGIILIVSGSVLYNHMYVKNKVYQEQEMFKSNGLEMYVIDSYQLDTDSFGNDISSGEYSYLVARISIKNISDNTISLGTENFELSVDGEKYRINNRYNDYFIELGDTSSTITLESKEEDMFILVYRIDQELTGESKRLEFVSGYTVNGGERIYHYININLKPKTKGEETKVKEVALNEKLTFEGSILKNSSITINSVEIADRFLYTYQQCIREECYTFNNYVVPKVNTSRDMTVMKLDFDLELDDSLYNDKLANNFISTLGHIRYVIDDKEYTQSIEIANITPDVVNNSMYYEISGDAKDADKVYLDIIVLDKIYTYTLK